MENSRTDRSASPPSFCAQPLLPQVPGKGKSELEPRVFVAHGKQSVRKSLADLLATKGYSVEIFASVAQFLVRAPHPGPGCVVLELSGGFDWLALQGQFMEQLRTEQIVFIGGHDAIRIGIEAIKRGAVDFLLKPFRDDELFSAVAQALARSAEAVEIRTRLSKLTPREFEVFRWIIAGLLNKEIGDKMGITLRTVKAHRTCVMRKIGVVSVVDLLVIALKGNIAPAQLGISPSCLYSAPLPGINNSATLTNRLAKVRPMATEQKVLANPEVRSAPSRNTADTKVDYSLSSQPGILFVS